MSGKGRGRGWLNLEKPADETRPGDHTFQQQPATPANCNDLSAHSFAINPQYEKIVHAISHFNDNDDGILLNKKFQYVQEVLLDACKTGPDAGVGFEYLYNKALADSNFTAKFIVYVSLATFNTIVIGNVRLRNNFLNLLQQNYNNAEVLYATNPHNFKNAIRIMSGFYEKAKMAVSGQTYKLLVHPIMHCLSMLLDSEVPEDIEFFTTQLYSCAYKLIDDGVDMKDISIKMRTTLASSTSLTEVSKLWLLLAIDLSNNEFRVLSTDLLNFYQMKLGNKDIFNFKKPLTVECTNYSINNKLNKYSSDVNVLEIDTNVSKLQLSNATDNHARTNKSPNSVENNDMMWNGNSNQAPPMKYRQKQNASGGRPILGSGARNNTNKPPSQSDTTGTSNWRSHKDLSPMEGPTNSLRKPKKGWEHDDRFETEYN